MEPVEAPLAVGETQVPVRYWAGARAATGLAEEVVSVTGTPTVAAVRASAVAAHPEAGRALQVCSVLVGDQPLGAADPTQVVVPAGSVVEFLPPFAGG